MTPRGVNAPAAHLLPPATLAALGDLRLATRHVVEGFVAGLHQSRRPGAGGDFLQYRFYQPGDDPRRLDWRAFARYVRETEAEREVPVRIVVDATGSMAHEDRSGSPAIVKLDYARYLAAAITWLADRQGDRVSLATIHDGRVETWSGRPGGRRTVERILHQLSTLQAAGGWPDDEQLGVLLEGAGRNRQRQLILVLSDLHHATTPSDDSAPAASRRAAPLLQTLSRLAAQGHEVVVLHLLGRDELEFRYQGELLFEDLETGHRVRGNADQLRPLYLVRLGEDLAQVRQQVLDCGASYQRIALDQPLDEALRHFLVSRQEAR